METGVVVAGAAAVAYYVYLKQQKNEEGDEMEPVLPIEACRDNPGTAPNSWAEALFHAKEVVR